MCKAFLVGGLALIVLGFAAFVHDFVEQTTSPGPTTIGDLLESLSLYYFRRGMSNYPEFLYGITVLPFSYAAMVTGVVAAAGGALCSANRVD
jgi:hypothetical protein